MKTKYLAVLLLILLPLISLHSQNYTLEALKNNPIYDVTVSEDSIAEIYNKHTNLSYQLNIKEFLEPENAKQADLIIELDTLDLSHWANLYQKWGRLDAANAILDSKFFVLDENENGKNEIYALQASTTTTELSFDGNIYENLSGSVFTFQLQVYDIATPIYDISDITNDGLLDVVYRSFENQLRFFKQSNPNEHITDFNFTYNPFPHPHQPNDVTFYDLNNDGIQELIYFLAAGTADSIWAVSNHVAKYNPAINNYELIYYHRPLPYFFTFGFAVGDFDNDGKNNFSTGSVVTKYYFYEYVNGDSIKVEHEKELETGNIFYSQMTDDINGNGKKEVWAGSQFASTQYGGVIRIYIMEASANESYDIIYQIDIRGMFSFKYGRIRYVDLDGDGIKEIFFNMGTLVFCFKYSNERNFYLDFIIDTWEDDPGYTHDNLEGVDVADLDSDGTAEIIMQKYVEQPFIFKSLFWKRDKTIDVLDENSTIPVEFNLYQNYPNPFNPETTIKFSLPHEAKVNIKIYNALGEEITELVNETRKSGEHELKWYGTDEKGNTIPSGIYFITLKSETLTKTIKSIYVK